MTEATASPTELPAAMSCAIRRGAASPWRSVR